MNKEDFFIAQIAKNSSSIGDDAAVFGELVYSQDAFFENVHFKREWMSLDEIAYKAMIVNISDAVAMNAKVKYALITLAMPSSITKDEMIALAKGFNRASKEFDFEIIGGDTISNTKLDISITIISQTKKPLRRIGLKHNDLIAYSGKLGNSKKELTRLFRGGSVSKLSRFMHPTLRDKFIYASAKHLRCGMDISDGLFSDMKKLLHVNKMGIALDKKISKQVGCSGEEYEMLFAFSRSKLKSIKRVASRYNVKITIVGRATRQNYTNRCKANHF